MAKDRKQDPGNPEEEALEQHVREMLDITVPDPPATVQAKPTETVKKPVSIKILDHNDLPDTDPAAKDNELAAAIVATNAELAAQTDSSTAPLVPGKKKPTKVNITHFDDSAETVDISKPDNEPIVDTPVKTTPIIVSADEEQKTQPTVEPEPASAPEIVAEAKPEPKEAQPIQAMPVHTVQDAIDSASAETQDSASPLEAEIESAATEQAVTDIIASESDELLAVQDKKLAKKSQPRKKRGLRRFFDAWIHSSAARWATFLVLFGALVSVGIVPSSRYYVLNKLGVRSTASVVVTDASTLRPLKNVSVSLGGETVQTDSEGKASLQKLRLGPTELVVSKRAYAEERKSVTIGWGSNPLGDVALVPKGEQYTFVVTDVFSGKPIANAEISAGESSATSGEDGVIKLTVDQTDTNTLELTLKAEGYRDETFSQDLSNKAETRVAMTPSKKVAFVSKRTGTYDVYTIDADGKNEKLVLAGTGSEADDLTFAPHQSADRAILVSTRDGKRANDGTLLQSLLSINLADGTTKTITEASQIRLIDWIGTRMIYVQLSPGTAPEDPSRYKLMSYDYVSGDNRQIAATNYFNDVLVAGSHVYFAPASAYQNGVNLGVFVVDADGNNKKPIFNQESWNMYRASYDHITLAVQQDWYDYTVGANSPNKLAGQPSNTTSRVYSDSPDSKRSIWIDTRDGKGTLVAYDTQSKQETVIYAQSGIKGPVRWLNNTTLVYRLSNGSETADYIVSTQGGEPKKLVNVTDTTGIDRWSY